MRVFLQRCSGRISQKQDDDPTSARVMMEWPNWTAEVTRAARDTRGDLKRAWLSPLVGFDDAVL